MYVFVVSNLLVIPLAVLSHPRLGPMFTAPSFPASEAASTRPRRS